MAPGPLTINVDRIPPYPDDLHLDRLFPEMEDTSIAAEAPNPSSPLRGNYVTKYLDIPWMYTMVESGKGNSHSESPPPIVDDDSDKPSDGNDDVNTTNNQRPAPSESKTTKPTYQKTSQSTGDTQKIAPTK